MCKARRERSDEAAHAQHRGEEEKQIQGSGGREWFVLSSSNFFSAAGVGSILSDSHDKKQSGKLSPHATGDTRTTRPQGSHVPRCRFLEG